MLLCPECVFGFGVGQDKGNPELGKPRYQHARPFSCWRLSWPSTKTPVSAISLSRDAPAPRPPSLGNCSVKATYVSLVPKPGPFSSSSSWGRDQVSVRTSGCRWRRSGRLRGTGMEGGGMEGSRATGAQEGTRGVPFGAPPPSTRRAPRKVCGGVRAGKAARMQIGGEGGGDAGCSH